jgi:oxalate decarboxylase family bicupin protein
MHLANGLKEECLIPFKAWKAESSSFLYLMTAVSLKITPSWPVKLSPTIRFVYLYPRDLNKTNSY